MAPCHQLDRLHHYRLHADLSGQAGRPKSGVALLDSCGVIGAYSTFSTYEWETLSTLRSGAFALAALYAVGSLILGLIAVWGGSALAEVL